MLVSNIKKSLLAVFMLLPISVFAMSIDSYANDANFNPVSASCYSKMKQVLRMLPNLPVEGLKVSKVSVPMGNTGHITIDVTATPTGEGIGHYDFYSDYKTPNLYLRADALPADMADKIDMIWLLLGGVIAKCEQGE